MRKKILHLIYVIVGLSVSLASMAEAVIVINPMTGDLDAAEHNIFNLNNIYATDIITEGPWIDVRSYASFSAAINAVGRNKKNLLIPDSQTITADEFVPPNVTLRFLNGGELNISSGVVVDINGPIDADLHQIFTGEGKVRLGRDAVKEVYPQWWGATGQGWGDDTVALQNCFDSIVDGQKIVIPPGWYYFNRTLRLDNSYSVLQCDGVLKWLGTDPCTAILIGGSNTTEIIRASIRLYNATTQSWDTNTIGIQVKNVINSDIQIEDCHDFTIGLQLVGDGRGTAYNKFTLGLFKENMVGVDFKCINRGYVNQNTFYGGRFSYRQTEDQTTYAGSKYVNIPYNATNPINNNIFYSPCFECAHGNNPEHNRPDYFVYCEGKYNAFIHPRNEGDTTITNVCFDSNSRGNLWIGGAHTYDLSSFVDKKFRFYYHWRTD